MTYQVSWYIYQRVLLIEGTGSLNLADLQQSVQTAIEMITADGQAPLVHIIYDTSQREDLAPDLLRLQPVQAILEKLHTLQNLGWFLMVDKQPNHVMKMITTLSAQIIGAKYRDFTDFERALAFLLSEDPTLPIE